MLVRVGGVDGIGGSASERAGRAFGVLGNYVGTISIRDFYVDLMELSVLRRMLLHVDIAIAVVLRVNTNSKPLNNADLPRSKHTFLQ